MSYWSSGSYIYRYTWGLTVYEVVFLLRKGPAMEFAYFLEICNVCHWEAGRSCQFQITDVSMFLSDSTSVFDAETNTKTLRSKSKKLSSRWKLIICGISEFKKNLIFMVNTWIIYVGPFLTDLNNNINKLINKWIIIIVIIITTTTIIIYHSEIAHTADRPAQCA